MLSHTFFTVGRKKTSLTEAIFNCIKWTLRFSWSRLTAPGQHFAFPTANAQWQDFLATGPIPQRAYENHPEALLGQPGMAQGWGAVVQPGSLNPEKTWARGATTITPGLPTVGGHNSLLCLQPAKASAQIWAGVQTAQAQGKVWSKCNLRLKISCRSTLGFLPIGCSDITFSRSPTAPNILSS